MSLLGGERDGGGGGGGGEQPSQAGPDVLPRHSVAHLVVQILVSSQQGVEYPYQPCPLPNAEK